MCQRSDAAGALNKMMRVPWVTSLENQFDPPEHLARAPGVLDFAAFDLYLDTKVAFDSGNWIYRYSFTHIISSFFLKKDYVLIDAAGYISS